MRRRMAVQGHEAIAAQHEVAPSDEFSGLYEPAVHLQLAKMAQFNSTVLFGPQINIMLPLLRHCGEVTRKARKVAPRRADVDLSRFLDRRTHRGASRGEPEKRPTKSFGGPDSAETSAERAGREGTRTAAHRPSTVPIERARAAIALRNPLVPHARLERLPQASRNSRTALVNSTGRSRLEICPAPSSST
jgi:hypothetical protein